MDYHYPKKNHQIRFQYAFLPTDGGQGQQPLQTVSSWDTFRLIPARRPIVNPPQVKTTYIEVPGFNGKLDFSDVIAGRAYMGPRSGTFDFNWSGEFPKPWNYGPTARKNLEFYLRHIFNGKLFNIIFDDDPNYFYRGRVQLKPIEFDSGGNVSKISLDYNLKPFKYNIKCCNNPLLDVDVVAKDVSSEAYHAGTVNGTAYITIRIPVVPTPFYIYTTGYNMTFNVIHNNTYQYAQAQPLSIGLNKIDKRLQIGDNIIVIYGSGTVLINYIEGRL